MEFWLWCLNLFSTNNDVVPTFSEFCGVRFDGTIAISTVGMELRVSALRFSGEICIVISSKPQKKKIQNSEGFFW